MLAGVKYASRGKNVTIVYTFAVCQAQSTTGIAEGEMKKTTEGSCYVIPLRCSEVMIV